KCRVVPFSHFRREDKPGYDIYFHPPLDDFPSGNDLEDATRINAILEQEIRKAPDQYLWMHRRFKTRPDENDPGFYGRARKKKREKVSAETQAPVIWLITDNKPGHKDQLKGLGNRLRVLTGAAVY